MAEGNRELACEENILDCGLKLLFYQEVELPPHSGDVYLFVKVGQINEENAEFRFSHLLEHVLLRAVNVEDAFLGMNDTHETLTDYTVFGFPVSSEDEISKAIESLAKIATKTEILDEHIEAERDVISVEHFEHLEDSEFDIQYAVESVMHYGVNKKDISATELFQERLSSISTDEVRAFYKKWYKLSNMCLIFVGNCTFQDILAKAKCHFNGGRGEQVERRTEDITKRTRIKVVDHVRINPCAFVIFEETRNSVKSSSDLKRHWDAKTKISAFNDGMKSVFGASVSGVWRNNGTRILHIFVSRSNRSKAKASTKVFSILYKEVCRAMSFHFSRSHLREARKQFLEKLELKTFKYSNNVEYRCSKIKNKLRNKFLYDDVAFLPSYELTKARKWVNSDSSQRKFKFLKRGNQYIIVNNVAIDKKAIGREMKTIKGKLSKPSVEEEGEENLTVEFDEVAKLPCNNQSITATKHAYPEIGLEEWTLSNGMKIAFHHLKHLDGCSLQGFAYGGISESRNDRISHKYATYVAEELNTSGDVTMFRDSLQVDISTEVGLYSRSFEAKKFKRSQLEILLQKIHLLFITNKLHNETEADTKFVLKDIASAIRENEEFGYHHALKTARGINVFSMVPHSDDASQINLTEACKYFNACFSDPSQFTVVIVGELASNKVESLIKKYLGSIPRERCPLSFPDDPRELKKIPIQFPENDDRTWLKCPFSTKLSRFYISIPVTFDTQTLDRDTILAKRCMRLMQDCLRRHLRHVLSKVYFVSCKLDCDGTRGGEFAIITFDFTAIHKDMTSDQLLLDEAIKALEKFRLSGPEKLKKMEVDDKIMQRFVNAYHFATSDRDVGKTYKAHEEMMKQIAAMGIEEMSNEIRRMFSMEFSGKHVAVVVRPNPDKDPGNDHHDHEHLDPVEDFDDFDEDFDDFDEDFDDFDEKM